MPLIACSVLITSLLLAYIILNSGPASFFMVLAGIFAVPTIYVILTQPQKGILVLLTLAYIVMFFSKLATDYPVGIVMDALVFLLVVSFFLKQKYIKDWSIFRGSISTVIIVWICYNVLEVINPAAESRSAWLYAVRPIAFITVSYFLFRFFIKDVQFIRTIFKLWICLSFVAAIYALKQEFFGFADFEMAAIKSDPLTASLYFIGNHWRKHSIFSDPVAFAYNMVISSILCFCLITGPMLRWKKIVLVLLGCLFIYSMLYSGTRGAYVLLPASFLLFAILKYNWKVMVTGLAILLVTIFLIFVPTSNYTLYRFQSAFKPGKDASYNLRLSNQKKIQPYIQSHPLGGGIGSTGVWGRRFSPNSYLAHFPPDSGYVRVAVELGWVGLFIFCTFMFIVLKTGIVNYFKIRDPELRSYCLAMVMIIFALHIGNYPQEALVQYPVNVYFYLAIALLSVTLKLDKEKTIEKDKLCN
jgi:cell division protein FtsW (lipid II flippase)